MRETVEPLTYVPDGQNTETIRGLVTKGHLSVSFVIPVLNEADNLPYVLPFIPDWASEIVLVDGYSTDNTLDVARRLCPHIRIVMQDGCGKGAALRTGFASATGSIIVMLDADGSSNPAEAEQFVHTLLNGADYAKGSRFLPGGGSTDLTLLRRIGNLALTGLVRLAHGGRYTDLCYGYNAAWKGVLANLNLDGDGFEIETMMNIRALRSGLKVVEVPSFEAKRIHGIGQLRTMRDGWRVLTTIVNEWLRPIAPVQPMQVEPVQVISQYPCPPAP